MGMRRESKLGVGMREQKLNALSHTELLIGFGPRIILLESLPQR